MRGVIGGLIGGDSVVDNSAGVIGFHFGLNDSSCGISCYTLFAVLILPFWIYLCRCWLCR